MQPDRPGAYTPDPRGPYSPGPHGYGPYPPYGPAPKPPGRGKGPVVAIIAALAVVVVALFGSLAYYGAKRYQERAKQAEQAREDAEKKVLPTSTYDATDDIVDDDFRLRLKWPGKGYKMLRQEEAQRAYSGAIAQVMELKGCMLMVTAEYAPGVDLIEMATALRTAVPGLQRAGDVSRITFLGRDAATFETDNTTLGFSYRQRHTVLERDGWFLRFAEMERRDLECKPPPAADVVTLLEGTVLGRNVTAASPDEDTPHYRIRGGTFASVPHRLRVEAPAGTTLGGPRLVAEIDRNAVAQIAAVGGDVIIDSLPAPATPIEALRTRWAEAAGEVTPVVVPSASATRTTDPIGAGALRTGAFETLFAFERIDDRLLVFRVTYAPSLRSQMVERVALARASTTVLSAEKVAELERSLPKRGFRKTGPQQAVRGGRFVHYGKGIRADLPKDTFRIAVEDGRDPSVVLHTAQPKLGIETVVSIGAYEPGGDIAAAQRDLASRLTAVDASGLSAGSAPALGSHARSRFGYLLYGEDASMDIVSITIGATVVHVAVSGFTSNVQAADPVTRAFLDGIDFATRPIEESVVREGHLISDRFGFEIELPGKGWTLEAKKSPAQMVLYEARQGKRAATIMAIALGDASGDFIASMLEQELIRRIAKGSDVPERAPAKLGALDANRVRISSKVDIVLATTTETLFVVCVEGSEPFGLEPDEVYRGFRLLP